MILSYCNCKWKRKKRGEANILSAPIDLLKIDNKCSVMLSKSLPTFTILSLVSRYRVCRGIVLHRAIPQWDVWDTPCAWKKYSLVVAGKCFWLPSATLPVFTPAATPPDDETSGERKEYHNSQKNVRQATNDLFLKLFSFLARWDWWMLWFVWGKECIFRSW